MTSVEQEIIERINHLNADQQRRVLDFVRDIDESEPQKSYSARELMKLPLQERNRLVIEALERSTNDDVEQFDAYSETDLDDE